ncbi:MAG: primosomal protein N', partial [Bacteroidota bacterium]|nr:primosomal protein N' [Bacteroidota bacterium]
VKLMRRWGDLQMPEILLADLKEEQKKKSMKSHFSSLLYNQMNRVLSEGGQIILFQNRRGYAPLLECQTCGWVPGCQNCDISLTYHQSFGEVICHYCGYKEISPSKCKACGSHNLKMLGFGTEKIEDELKIFFTGHNSLRMDQDTTRAKDAFTRIINALEDGEAEILVGTQMVTKGLDFDNVRLVGVLNADQMLRYPDFRAIERSYQLMAQVSGRAGRKTSRGGVVIQTYSATHPVFRFLKANDYEGFYQNEISERFEYQYPPFYKLIKFIVKDMEIEKVKQGAAWLADRLKNQFGSRILGPEFPPVARIRNQYNMHIMMKCERQDFNMTEAKKDIKQMIEDFRRQKTFGMIRVNIDVDPY